MKKKLILASLVVVAIAGSWALLGEHGGSHAQSAGPGGALPEVTVARALLRPVSNSADFTGRVQPVDSVQVRPRVGGYVDSVSFREGALVHKGDVLFRIDPRPFQAEVDRLAANRSQAQAELGLAQANAQRGRRLLDQRAIAQEEADRLDTAAQSARASLAAADAALATAKLNLGFTEVRAPVDGRVSNVHITPGNLVTSADVNHGFGIYDADLRLVAQTQAMPGYTNRLRHTFAAEGTYRVLCMEYCGLVHHNMITEIKVVKP